MTKVPADGGVFGRSALVRIGPSYVNEVGPIDDDSRPVPPTPSEYCCVMPCGGAVHITLVCVLHAVVPHAKVPGPATNLNDKPTTRSLCAVRDGGQMRLGFNIPEWRRVDHRKIQAVNGDGSRIQDWRSVDCSIRRDYGSGKAKQLDRTANCAADCDDC